MNAFKAFLFCTLSMASTMHANVVQSSLCVLFGNEQVSDRIQKPFSDANKLLGMNTTAYKMNDWAKKLGMSSFTWAGATWFDEEILAYVSDSSVTFEATHEPCHDYYWHGLKRVGTVAACIGVPCILFSSHIGKIAASALLLTAIVPRVSRMFERNADALAARMLCATDNKNIVTNYCADLEKHNQEKPCPPSWAVSLWFDSLDDRITHLNTILADELTGK
jgi:hypothetical protein